VGKTGIDIGLPARSQFEENREEPGLGTNNVTKIFSVELLFLLQTDRTFSFTERFK
jgi:hypothetical protein